MLRALPLLADWPASTIRWGDLQYLESCAVIDAVYPDDWVDDEMYEFDWTTLGTQTDRFGKLNYDAIPQ